MSGFLKKLTTGVTLLSFLASSTLIPAANAYAAAASTVHVGGVPVDIPRPEYQTLSVVQFAPKTGFSAKNVAGNSVSVNMNQAAAFLGISSDKVPAFVSSMPSSSSMVFGRYSPSTAELRVDVIKLQRTGNTVSVMSTQFTPKHGNYWAAQRTYMTPAEKAASSGPGPNPFARFTAADANFHGVNFGDVQVVVGSAMRFAGASSSIISIANSDVTTRTEKSGGWLRKTITTIYEGTTKPSWYVGFPMDAATSMTAAVCVDAGVGSACNPYHMVMPFASFVQWDGGNLPTDKTKVFEYRESKKSWTVLAMAIFFTALSFAAAEAYALAAGTAAGPAGVISGFLGQGFTSLGIEGMGVLAADGAASAAAAAGVEGLAYLGEQMVFNGGGATAAQSNFYGKVSDGVTAATEQTTPYGKGVVAVEKAIALEAPLGGAVAYNTANQGALGKYASAVSQYDAGYNQVKPEVGSSAGFNSSQYVQDTQ